MIGQKENGRPVLQMENIYKTFYGPGEKEALNVLEDITLRIDKGEIITLIGPSGCGKSTILNLAAGFETPDSGILQFMGETISAPSVKRGVVFQSAVLFPWLTVKQNIAYGLKLQKFARHVIDEKCREYIHLVELEGFEHYYPNQLSGGMQQRVSLARVLIMEPEMLLMDEPFASLDAQTRMSMQQLLISISDKLSPSIFFITHDVEEALFLSDRIYVMSRLPGHIRKEITVPFSRPRDIALFSDIDFAKMKTEIFHMLFD